MTRTSKLDAIETKKGATIEICFRFPRTCSKLQSIPWYNKVHVLRSRYIPNAMHSFEGCCNTCSYSKACKNIMTKKTSRISGGGYPWTKASSDYGSVGVRMALLDREHVISIAFLSRTILIPLKPQPILSNVTHARGR